MWGPKSSARLSLKANWSLQKSFFFVFLSPKGFSLLLLPTTSETKCLPYRRIQGSCLFHFCTSHHQINSLLSTAQGAGQQLDSYSKCHQLVPSLEDWKKHFSRLLLPVSCHLSALFTLTEARPWTGPTSGITHLWHQHCPDSPAHKHQGLPGCPDISAPAFLTFLTVTIRPLMLLSVHTTSLDTRDPSWVTSQPGRLAELLEGQR